MADWSWIEDNRVLDAVNFFAASWSRRFGSREDARHEAFAYISEHPSIIEGDIGSGLIYMRLAQRVGRFQPDDEEEEVHVPMDDDTVPETVAEEFMRVTAGTYTVEAVARMIPLCYSMEHVDAYSDPFGEELRPAVSRFTRKDPSHANTLWAALSDLRAVYCHEQGHQTNKAQLSLDEQRALLCKYGLDMTRAMMLSYGVKDYTADIAIRKIVNMMNQ